MDGPALTRRDTLKISLLGAAALSLPYRSVLSAREASQIAPSKLPRPYTVPFRSPPVASPTVIDGIDHYEITQKMVVREILPGIKTELYAYNGSVPGPTIKAYRGRPTVVRQINQLPAQHARLGYVPWTSTHLHGMPSEPQYDGYAGDNSLPGQWKDYHYPNTCEARTLWYHDHGVHHTAENVYMGLAAQYHILDDVERALPIPKGRYDVPLIISDVMFAENGQLMWDDEGHSGVYGDVILVNGAPWPTMQVERRKYRFRLLNGSLSRGYRLQLSDGTPLQVIATDGGLMDRPRSVSTLTLGMGERDEVVIDFAAYPIGTKVQLVNLGVDNARDYDNTDKIMQFHVTADATDTANNTVPEVLAPLHSAMALKPSDAVATRRMTLDRSNGLWTVNGTTWQDVEDEGYATVFANPQPGDVEIWEVANLSGGWFHPTHIHFVDFQILDRNGQPPRPEELGPKDVVYIGENETVRLLMQFSKPGGTHGRFMIHCHNLSHEDHDMMTQFQIGDHDADCDPINTRPPSSVWPPPPLGDPMPPVTAGPTPTGTPAPSPTTAASTPTAPTTTTTTTAPTTTAPTTSRRATKTPRRTR